MNPIAIAIRGKGPINFIRRATSISRRYGVTPTKMEQSLEQMVGVLRQSGCGATLPITAVALHRNLHSIAKYPIQGIEFAIHGYRHQDHWQLTQNEQEAQLTLAKAIFQEAGIHPKGFRSPYLHSSANTLAALQRQGFDYDSSQGLAWDVLDGRETPAYRYVLNFYGALSATNYLSLPSLENSLVLIPYGLPDDEALIERLALETPDEIKDIWLTILRRSYQLGELFTLGLHPERAALCLEALTAVLAEARSLHPPVWIARLDEIAAWWRTRCSAQVNIADTADGKLHLTVLAPERVAVLARGVEIHTPASPWVDGYHRIAAREFTVQAGLRPLIGLSPNSAPRLADFLRQQGYLLEIAAQERAYSYYFDQAEFIAEQERPLAAYIENTNRPLVRLGRWPEGARSALAITGDIDALTLQDYGWRFLSQ